MSRHRWPWAGPCVLLGRAGALGLALTVLAGPSAGQDASPIPVASDPGPMASAAPTDSVAATGDLAATFPTGIGDMPWQHLSILSGPELLAGLDPQDPDDAERIARTERFLEGTGGSVADLTSATGFRVEPDGAFSFVNAYEVAGAEPGRMRDVVLREFVESYTEEMVDPVEETLAIDGRLTVVLRDMARTDASGTSRPVYFYVEGDTAWVVNVEELVLPEAIENLRPTP